jgi:hypothetical protein
MHNVMVLGTATPYGSWNSIQLVYYTVVSTRSGSNSSNEQTMSVSYTDRVTAMQIVQDLQSGDTGVMIAENIPSCCL